MITIQRRNRFCLCLRAYVIYVDGKRKCRLKRGKKISFHLEPGEHTIYARVDYCTSKPYHLIMEGNEEITLECDSVEGVYNYLTYMLIHPDQLLELKRI